MKTVENIKDYVAIKEQKNLVRAEKIEAVTKIQIEVLTENGKRLIVYEGIDLPTISISNNLTQSKTELKFNYKSFSIM